MDQNDDPDQCDSDHSDDWNELDTSSYEQTTCLFCPSAFHTIAVALDHCKSEHKFNLLDLKVRYRMDCYSYIKMINYIRTVKPNPDFLVDNPSAPPWDEEKYLKPIETEPWLMYDFDDLGSAPSTPHYAIDGKDPINNITYADLLRQIRDLTMEMDHKDELLQRASMDMERMKQVSKSIIDASDSAEVDTSKIRTLPLGGAHTDYFNSYSHFGIHHEMLSDTVRTEAYRTAILKNPSLFKGADVLDLGCGTGILSMFSSDAGANLVVGVDGADHVLECASKVLKENNKDQIVLVLGRIEKTPLPYETFDVIVSEWMGYFLLYEGMLDSIIFARDRYLKKDGKLLPNRCTMHMVAVSDKERYDKLIGFWSDVYGYSMSCLRKDALAEPNVDTVPVDKVISEPCTLTDIDLYTCTKNDVNFQALLTMPILSDGVVTSLAGYFDTYFDLPDNSSMFSTSPQAKSTHWQQTIFYLPEPVPVNKGDTLNGTLHCSRMKDNIRGLTITIKLQNKDELTYHMD